MFSLEALSSHTNCFITWVLNRASYKWQVKPASYCHYTQPSKSTIIRLPESNEILLTPIRVLDNMTNNKWRLCFYHKAVVLSLTRSKTHFTQRS